jgi:hypothetical protein
MDEFKVGCAGDLHVFTLNIHPFSNICTFSTLSNPGPVGVWIGWKFSYECHMTYILKLKLTYRYYHTEVLRVIYNLK